MNIRLWKAEASQPVGPVQRRQRTALRYGERLRERFRYHPLIRRVARHRHVPRLVYKQSKERRAMLASRHHKQENVIRHSKPGRVQRVAERKKHVVEVKE